MLVCLLFLTASSCQPARHLLDRAVTFLHASSHVSLGHTSKGSMPYLADLPLQAMGTSPAHPLLETRHNALC